MTTPTDGLAVLTLDMVTAMFSQTVEPVAILATIQAEGMDGLLRLSSSPDRETSNGRPGIISRGEDFEFFPFEFAFSGAGKGEATRDAQVKIGNRSGEIAEALEGVTGQPVMTLEMVRTSLPDQVERAMTNAMLTAHEEDGPSITGTIKPRRFDTEPACKFSYISARTPSLF